MAPTIPRGRSSKPRLASAGETARAHNVRAHNRALVLRLVWAERTISRAELARRTGLSRSTVSNITDELLETGLVREAGEGLSLGGKPPKLLSCNDDVYGVIGVDMGARHIGVALTNLRGRIVTFRKVEHDVRNDPEGTVSLLVELIGEAARQREGGMRRAVGIGLAVPAPLDPANPNAFSQHVLPRWTGVRLHDVLTQRFQAPVYFDNDANLGALAEHWWGAGADGSDLAFIKLGTGIGCGLVINGSIYRGARFLAGEIGHLTIDPNGPTCDCGRRGCLVNYVGTPALLARAKSSMRPAPKTIASLVDAANLGDVRAAELLDEAAKELSVTVCNLVNLVNPATVVLGGGLSRAGARLLVPISVALLSRYHWVSEAKTNLVVSSLGESGIALGAATAVLSRALENPTQFSERVRA